MQDKGLIIGGVNKKLNLVETIELKDHPWFIGVQFHPELKSRVMKAHPLFNSFIESAIKYSNAPK
jgi:CTP synthase